MRVAVAVLSVVLVVCTACGGNGDGGEQASESAIDPEAQTQAESFLLKLSDFPNGWRGSAPEAEDEEANESFRRCAGIDYSSVTKIGDADSLDFAMGQSTEASSEATVFASAEEAEEGMNEFSDGMNGTKIEDCLQDFIEDNVEPGSSVEVGEVDIGQFNVTPPDVEDAAAWQIVIPIEITSGAGEGLTPNFYLEFVVLREGANVAMVQTSDVLTEFDSELRDDLVEAVAGRMSGATS